MKIEKSIKRFIAIRRKHNGKKNGVIPYLWDWPSAEIAMDKSKTKYRRHAKHKNKSF